MRHLPRFRSTLAVLLLAAPAGADEVYLEGGGKLTGEVVERTATTLVIETGPGRIGVPLARVKRVVHSPSSLSEYRRRAAALAETDVQGWLALARWARQRDLDTQAREAFERVRRLDPDNADAQTALGNVSWDGRWMTADEARRAQGLVNFEGDWITPEERAERVRTQREEAIARQERAEAEARAREAEARAQAAEAEARRAESEARAAEEGGLPVWFGGGPGVIVDPDCAGGCCAGSTCEPEPQAPAPGAPAKPRRGDGLVGRDHGSDVKPPSGVRPSGPAPGARPRGGGATQPAGDGRPPNRR